jgi:hypothetical protein
MIVSKAIPFTNAFNLVLVVNSDTIIIMKKNYNRKESKKEPTLYQRLLPINSTFTFAIVTLK